MNSAGKQTDGQRSWRRTVVVPVARVAAGRVVELVAVVVHCHPNPVFMPALGTVLRSELRVAVLLHTHSDENEYKNETRMRADENEAKLTAMRRSCCVPDESAATCRVAWRRTSGRSRAS